MKTKAKARKIEKRTVFVFQDGENVAIRKRPAKGLLAGLYELPNIEGELSADEALEYSKKIGLQPLRIKELGVAKHIFSHVEWHMTGFAIRVDELEKSCTEKMLFIHPEEVQREYPIPAAFEYYTDFVDIKLGQENMRNKNRTSSLLVLNCLSGYGRLFFECSHIYELITDYSHCTGTYHVDHRVLL